MKKKKENEVNKNIHWENEKREKLEAAQRQRIQHEKRQKQKQHCRSILQSVPKHYGKIGIT